MRRTLPAFVMILALAGGCTVDTGAPQKAADSPKPSKPAPSPTGESSASTTRPLHDCDLGEGMGGRATVVSYLLEPDWRIPRRNDFVPAERALDKSERLEPLRTALLELLDGSTRHERRMGCQSAFDDNARLLRSVAIDDGLVTVNLRDFTKDLPGVGTTTASTIFMMQLNLTVFQFPNVESIRYELSGSCERFFRMLEGNCQIFHRQGDGWRIEVT